MNAFLASLKADLLDRRLRAVLLAVCLGLVGTLVYALTGGSGGTPAPATAAAPPSSASAISPVAASPTGNQAVAETTSGAPLQREGKSRDPFTPLPGSKASTTAAVAQPAAASASSSQAAKGAAQKASQPSSGSSGGSEGGSSSTAGKPKHAAHKPKTVYRVAILFGALPEGTPAADAQLTPFTNVKPRKKFPSHGAALLSFHEVTAGGKRVVFELLGEALLKGSATCLPSASQCRSIALAQGQSEELEYLPAAGGRPVVYELQVVSITSSKAAAARARISLLHRLHRLSLLTAPATAALNG
jgi:hypothetical protein